MADFKISQLPLASDAAAGDFVIINKDNTTTNRIDVKELVEGFGDVKYLRTDVGAGDQTVASTGTTTFDGLVEAGEGVKVMGGTASLVNTGISFSSTTNDLIIINDFNSRIVLNSSGRASIRGSNTLVSVEGESTGSGGLSNSFRAAATQAKNVDRYNAYQASPVVSDGITIITAADYCAYETTLGTGSVIQDKRAFEVRSSIAVGTNNNYGFYGNLGSDGIKNYNFYADGTAPNFFKGDTYIGGTTTRNTRELWESTLTEEQKEQLAAGTLVVPANVSLPGDGSFARQWWYDQQDEETQALIDAGELEYPEHFQVATFTDTFDLGDNTAINLLSNGLGEFSGGVKVTGGSLATVPDGIYKESGETVICNNGVEAIRFNDVNENLGFYTTPASTVKVEFNNREKRRGARFAIGNASATEQGNRVDLGLVAIQAVSIFKPGTATTNVTGFLFGSNNNVASADVTNQYGFYVNSNANTAVNNYGFYSFLGEGNDQGGNNYNFFAGGDAPNYFKGNTFIGDLPTATSFNTSTTNKAISCFAGTGAVGNSENASIRVQAATDSPVPILTTWNNDNSLGGSIQKAPNGDLSFVNPSDYRFKSDIVDLPNATEAIKALRPRQYTFKDIPNQIGFVAHELQQVVPDAVTGVKDGEKAIGTLLDWNGSIIFENGPEPPAEELEYTEDVETDGVTTQVVRTRSWTPTGTRPVYQGVDQTKLIPLLTKALQEALEEIDNLKARLDVLEGN